jgi:hypothetical protein
LHIGDSIIDLFRYPTISAFARFLELKAASGGAATAACTNGGTETVAPESIPPAWRRAGSNHA